MNFSLPSQRPLAPLGVPRVRGHRRAGGVLAHTGERHTGVETVALIGVIASVAAAGVGAYATYQQGQTQKKVAEFQAETQRNQAILAQRAASERARDIRERNRRIQGAAIAQAGAAGLTITPGTSPLEVLSANQRATELDVTRALYAGQVERAGLESTSALRLAEGKAAAQAGTIGAAGTILGAGASAGTKLYGARASAGSSAPLTASASQIYEV